MEEEKLRVMAQAVRQAYRTGEEDEKLLPRVLIGPDHRPLGRIRAGEPVIFYDIRGEREVELTEAFVSPGFNHFDTQDRLSPFATMIEYHSSLPVKIAFPPEVELTGALVETLIQSGKRVVKIVESEKAVHLSYFLNGKRETPFPGERRVTVESPKDVNNYDEKPEMAAPEVTARVLEELAGDAEVIVVNYANVDVVAHIENEAAVIAAVEAVDRELGRIVGEARKRGVTAVITADHGTAEKWLYPDGKIDTGHTDSPVPFIIVEKRLSGGAASLHPGGALTDVAPTALGLMGITVPAAMTGRPLFTAPPAFRSSRLLLVILDGWGHREEAFGNLIKKAHTPTMDSLIASCPFTTLEAHGEAVGMPPGKVGNSESGHLHLGAGRRVLSDRIRIDAAIADGSFAHNPAFAWAMDLAIRERKPLHLLGIVSFYSSHGSVTHLYELLKMAKARGVHTAYHHALLGRRGERPEAGARYIDDVERFCEDLGLGRVVTVMGRFWALDREQNWDRVEKAYRALAGGEGIKVKDTR